MSSSISRLSSFEAGLTQDRVVCAADRHPIGLAPNQAIAQRFAEKCGDWFSAEVGRLVEATPSGEVFSYVESAVGRQAALGLNIRLAAYFSVFLEGVEVGAAQKASGT